MAAAMNPIKQTKVKLIGLKKLLLPVKDLDLMRTGGPTRALFGFLPRTSAKESGRDLADFLKRVQLFEDLGVGDLRRLARLVHERSYRDGEYLFEQGKPGAAMFVIRTGVVDILRRGRNGEEVHFATLEPPASLGESELMGAGAVRWCSARARGPVSIVALGRSDLEALSHNFPLLANKVLAKLAQITALRLQLLVEELTSEQKDSE
jgi:CRP-like cAMP-binding protein